VGKIEKVIAMKHTISVLQRGGEYHRVAMMNRDVSQNDAMKAACRFSHDVELCDVVVSKGRKHVATYRNGEMIAYMGQEHTP
jgi:hypothetical protein